MLNAQEFKVLIFLLAVILLGSGIDFITKQVYPVKKFLTLDENFSRLDINLASEDDLTLSRCVSRSLAKKIVAYRQAHGPFSDLEEIKNVPGIGKVRLERIKKTFFVPCEKP